MFYNAAVKKFYLRIPGKLKTKENINKFGCIQSHNFYLTENNK